MPLPLKPQSELPEDQSGGDSRPWKEGLSGWWSLWYLGLPFLLTVHNMSPQNGGREHALI